jgi:hypothetical protein
MNGLTEDQERDYRATVRIRDRAEDIAVYVATWQDESRERATRRQALTEAVDAVDAMVRAARQLRQSLVTQARDFDDESMRRSGELLERIRKERES